MPSEEDQATVTGNMHKNLVRFGHVVFILCEWTERRTDRQTYLSQVWTLPWAKL